MLSQSEKNRPISYSDTAPSTSKINIVHEFIGPISDDTVSTPMLDVKGESDWPNYWTLEQKNEFSEKYVWLSVSPSSIRT